MAVLQARQAARQVARQGEWLQGQGEWGEGAYGLAGFYLVGPCCVGADFGQGVRVGAGAGGFPDRRAHLADGLAVASRRQGRQAVECLGCS